MTAGRESSERRKPITRLAAMPGKKPLTALLALAATVTVVAGCGSNADKTIPPTDAQTLNQQLSAVQQAVAAGDCATALSNAQRFIDTVNQLPDTAGADTKTALRTAGDQLKTLASDPAQCQPSGTTGLTGSKPRTTTSTTPTTTTTTPTTTSTTTTSTTTTKSAPPPSEGGNPGGNPGGGNGGGGANGGTSGGTGGTGAGKR
jgi:outer membrane murein-binding lipoprotein Lpp